MVLTEKVALRREHTDMPGAVEPPSGLNDPYLTDDGTGPAWAEREHNLDYHTDVDAASPSDNDVIQYNDATGMFEVNALPHSELSGITTDDHHAKSHAHDGVDGSGTVAHADLTGITADDHHTKYTDAEAEAVADTQIATHAAIADAHHTKYTDAEAEAVADTQIATHAAIADAHHAKYTDAEAEAVADTQIATHAAISDAHHAKYTDGEAVAAMGTLGDANPLNHDRYTDAEAVSATAASYEAAGAIATHASDADAHHNQAHAIDGADHTASGLTAGHVLQATSPTTIAFGAPPAGTPASTVTDETSWGVSAAVGTDTEYARQDHTHGSPVDPDVAGAISTHASDASAHHAKYTDAEAVAAVEATADYIDLTDGGETALHSHAGGVTDHGALTGLTDDDHTQYLLDKASGGVAAEVPTHTHANSANAGTVAHSALTGIGASDHHAKYTDAEARAAVAADESGIDHGSISGLSGDDHSQYLLANGGRTLSGTMLATSGIRPVINKVRVTTSRTVPNNTGSPVSDTGYAIEFDDAIYDSGNTTYGDTSCYSAVNPPRLTVNRSGFYHVTAQVAWAANASGGRVAALFTNGGRIAIDEVATGAGGREMYNHLSADVYLSAGSYFYIRVFQNSGGNLDYKSYRTWMSAYYIGPY